jgi:hypothetical protein
VTAVTGISCLSLYNPSEREDILLHFDLKWDVLSPDASIVAFPVRKELPVAMLPPA